jgi:hypothetical protein
LDISLNSCNYRYFNIIVAEPEEVALMCYWLKKDSMQIMSASNQVAVEQIGGTFVSKRIPS